MDTRRLQLLLALSRLGSMRAVADVHHLTTSTVSQQIAALARETGAQLIEPEGRRVRLTPAGQRLADHAVTILAAVDSARLDLDPDAEPAGTVRVGGFATGRAGFPAADSRRPGGALSEGRIRDQRVRADRSVRAAHERRPRPGADVRLQPRPRLPRSGPGDRPAVVGRVGTRRAHRVPPTAAADIGAYADQTWIVNSRNTADEDAVRTLASLAGFTPRIAHEIDSLDLVEDLIVAGYGVGLLPIGRPTHPDVTVLPLSDPTVVLTAYAATRRGRSTWPPLRVVLDRLRPPSRRAVAAARLAATGRVIGQAALRCRVARLPGVGRPQVGTGRALQVHHRALIAQQVLPMRRTVGAALAVGAGAAVLAAGALQPGAASPVRGRINRQHDRRPARAAHRR